MGETMGAKHSLEDGEKHRQPLYQPCASAKAEHRELREQLTAARQDAAKGARRMDAEAMRDAWRDPPTLKMPESPSEELAPEEKHGAVRHGGAGKCVDTGPLCGPLGAEQECGDRGSR
jgi:hypothetical protein